MKRSLLPTATAAIVVSVVMLVSGCSYTTEDMLDPNLIGTWIQPPQPNSTGKIDRPKWVSITFSNRKGVNWEWERNGKVALYPGRIDQMWITSAGKVGGEAKRRITVLPQRADIGITVLEDVCVGSDHRFPPDWRVLKFNALGELVVLVKKEDVLRASGYTGSGRGRSGVVNASDKSADEPAFSTTVLPGFDGSREVLTTICCLPPTEDDGTLFKPWIRVLIMPETGRMWIGNADCKNWVQNNEIMGAILGDGSVNWSVNGELRLVRSAEVLVGITGKESKEVVIDQVRKYLRHTTVSYRGFAKSIALSKLVDLSAPKETDIGPMPLPCAIESVQIDHRTIKIQLANQFGKRFTVAVDEWFQPVWAEENGQKTYDRGKAGLVDRLEVVGVSREKMAAFVVGVCLLVLVWVRSVRRRIAR